MFKKIWYILSILLGISVFLKITKERQESQTEEIPTIKSSPARVVKRVAKELNKRQLEITKLLEKRQILLPSDVYALHPQVSTRTLRRDMTSLVELGLVRQEGSTKDTRYIVIES